MEQKKGIKLTASDVIQVEMIDTLQDVMEYGAERGKSGWEELPVDDHVQHALAHILDYIDGDTSEPHLGHAFTRLGMAVTIERRARKKVDGINVSNLVFDEFMPADSEENHE